MSSREAALMADAAGGGGRVVSATSEPGIGAE